MRIFPAIDLRGGQVVRLIQGDFNRESVYSSDPGEVARGFAKAGAGCLHVVDLDGARDGVPVNTTAIQSILSADIGFVEIGGGVRDEDRIRHYLDLGLSRVILGTVAVTDYRFTAAMIQKYGDKIAVGVDARNGKVAVKGWLEDSAVDAMALCKRLDDAGVDTIIYTDIARDGGLEGTNLPAYRQLRALVSCKLTASGGIHSMADLDAVEALGIEAAILGKSLYTGALDLQAVLARFGA